MADTDALRSALIDAALNSALAVTASVQAALATAGLLDTAHQNAMKQAGIPIPAKNLQDAGALASQAAQAAAAARDLAQAVTTLPSPDATP